MKTINIIGFGIIAVVISIQAHAEDYTLKRAVITWDGGFIDDSAIAGTFSASGSMSVVGNRITQNITLCNFGTCEQVVENVGSVISHVAENTARISLRFDDETQGDLTILSLFPNIITLFVYDDGTAETHEWEPVR